MSKELHTKIEENNEIENIAFFISEKAEHRGWDNAQYMAAAKFGEDKVRIAIEWLYINDITSQYAL